MKKVLIIVLVILFLGTISFGQEINLPQKGNKAMLFEFSGLGFLGVLEYQGGFGYKMFLNNNMALRTALLMNYNKDNTPYTGGGDGKDGYDKTFGMGAEIALELHKNYGNVSPYTGIGGKFVQTTTESALPVQSGSTQPTLKNQIGSGSGMNIGGFFIIGMEYFINDNISLSGEYHLGVDYTSALTEVYDDGTNKIETDGGSSLGFGISSIGLFTLAIYR